MSAAESEPWVAELLAGRSEAAWDLFVEKYRRLIFATIRHYADGYDDVMDLFAQVCAALRADGMARVKAFFAEPTHRAQFSTWLVVVVRNQILDWFRHRDGRKRLGAVAAAFAPVRRRIFEYVFVEGRSHLEAFELVTSRDGFNLSFTEFGRELRRTYLEARAGRRGALPRDLAALPVPEGALVADDPAAVSEMRSRILAALEELPADERLAVLLFVVDELPAAGVARIVSWPNAKAVYNRVHRALAGLRMHFERLGIHAGDL